MKTLLVTQARYGSTRFPGKVLEKVGNKTLLQIHLERLKRSTKIEHFLVATTQEPEANAIVDIAKGAGFSTYQGSLTDVLDRFYQAACEINPDTLIRVTSDCPLNDGLLIDEMLEAFVRSQCDYLSNTQPATFPDGLDVEIMRFSALKTAWAQASDPIEREHVTPYIYRRPGTFKISNFAFEKDLSNLRLTLDYPEDRLLLTALIEAKGDDRSWKEYVSALEKSSQLQQLNSQFSRVGV